MRETEISRGVDAESPVSANNEQLSALYSSVQGSRWAPATMETPAPVLGTLLVFAYFREIYSSSEIVLAAQDDILLRYICTNRPPPSSVLRSFRRDNRAAIEHALANLLRLQPLHSSSPRTSPWQEAKRRVNIAVRTDCFDLDV